MALCVGWFERDLSAIHVYFKNFVIVCIVDYNQIFVLIFFPPDIFIINSLIFVRYPGWSGFKCCLHIILDC